ncbi:MAG: relaxase/mobilization nuclease domain-containing protein [Clostridiales bacterium]|nr:relaxase/mobilization nuclease domain-containing protein [Clostridiales bacterium]
MAIIKHIASKNQDYTAAERYLIFEHNEKTGKLILDTDGYPVQKKNYILDGINCDPGAFAAECRTTNRVFKKNTKKGEIKTHHYIISFDPQDRELGLTLEQAQKMCLEFARTHFPGHQMLVCAHEDGQNGAGNIHVHIVLNSVRKLDTEPLPYKQRKYDCKAGYKHNCTKDLMKFLRADVMKMCQDAGLHQVDLFQSDRRVTDREYRAAQQGQAELDKQNAERLSAGEPVKQTKFETEKERIRQAILSAAAESQSVAEFRKILLESYHIQVKESRGRWSYIPSGRERGITSRNLGDAFGKEAIERTIFEKRRRIAEQTAEHEPVGEGALSSGSTKSATNHPVEDTGLSHVAAILEGENIGKLIDSSKAGDSEAYAQWIKVHNLQEQAKTFNFMSEHGLLSGGELDEEYAILTERFRSIRASMKDTEAEIKDRNKKLRLLGQYYKGKSVYREYVKGGRKEKFKKEHQAELTLYETAGRELREIFGDSKLPNLADLKAEKVALQTQKDAQYAEFQSVRKQWMELGKVIQNRDSFLARHPLLEREQKKEIN